MKKYLSLLLMAVGILVSNEPAKATVVFSDNFESGSWGAGWAMENWVVSASTPILTTSGGPQTKNPNPYNPGSMFGPNAVVQGEGGANQGTYVGKLYPDYDYAPNWANNSKDLIILKQQKTVTQNLLDIAAESPDKTIRMNLDYKFQPIVESGSGAFAYFSIYSNSWDHWYTERVALDFNNGEWGNASVAMTLDNAGQIGANILFGVGVYAQNYSKNGLYIDNVVTASVPEPSVASLLGFGVLGLVATRLRRRS
jgi:hypothetical protein